jgi:hypothetical protein
MITFKMGDLVTFTRHYSMVGPFDYIPFSTSKENYKLGMVVSVSDGFATIFNDGERVRVPITCCELAYSSTRNEKL